MFFKICRISLVLLTLNCFSVSAQNKDAEKQRAEYEQKLQEDLDKLTQDFINDLKIDDFQKEIIKQKIQSYFVERKKIFQNIELKYFERDEQLAMLTNNHFEDIKEMISDDTMTQIKSFVKDGGAELKKTKKKNKKKTKKD